MVLILYLAIAAAAYGQVTGNTVTVLPKGDGSATGELRLRELPANGQNYVGFKAPDSIAASPGNLIWKLPDADAVGALCSDGALNLTFGCSAALPVPQSTAIVIGVADPTKVLKFDVDSSLTTGATRTLTVPDESTTIVGTENHRYGTTFLLQTFRANGTAASPTPVNNGDILMRFYGWMRGATGDVTAGDIRYEATHDGTNRGSKIIFSNARRSDQAFGGTLVMDDDWSVHPWNVGSQDLGTAASYWNGIYGNTANLYHANAVQMLRSTRISSQNLLWNVSGGGNGSWLFGAGPGWDNTAQSGINLYHFNSPIWRIGETGDSTQTGGATIGGNVIPGGTSNIGSTGARWNNGFFNTLTLSTGSAQGFASDIVPNSNGVRDVGNASFRWKKMYVQDIDANGSITAGGIVSGHMYPAATLTYTFGNSSSVWNAGWFRQLNATETLHLGTAAGQGFTTDVLPATTGFLDLGNSSQYWRDIYMNGRLLPQGASVTLGTNASRFANIFSNLVNLSSGSGQGFGSHVVPATHNTYTLGTTSQRWSKLWVTDIDVSGTCTGCGGGGGLLPNTISLGDYSTASTCAADVSADMSTAISDLVALGGGTLIVPAGQWCFDSTVVIASNKIMIQGVSTSGNNGAPSASRLAWRNAPGSPSPLIQFQATKGGGMKDITLQGRSLANTRLLRLINASYGFYENVQGEQWTNGPGLSLTTDTTIGFFTDEFACHNTFTHIYFTNVSDGSNASGVMLDGSDHEDRPGSPQPGSACSNTFVGGRFDFSKGGAATYGVKLKAADNNLFLRTNLWASGDHATTRPAMWWVQHSSSSFPKENNFIGVTPAVQNGFYASQGTAGTGGNWVQLNVDDCGGPVACTPNVDGVVGRTNTAMFGTSNFPTKISQAGTLTADMLVFDQFSGTYNGAGAWRMDRQGTTYYRLWTDIVYGMTWATRPNGGELVDRWMMTGDGHWRPAADGGVDVGSQGFQVANTWSRSFQTKTSNAFGTQTHNYVSDKKIDQWYKTYTSDSADDSSIVHFQRTRGSAAGPSSVSSGDRLGGLAWWAQDASSLTVKAKLMAYAGAGVTDSELRFSTTSTGGTNSEVLFLGSSYLTGSGLTATFDKINLLGNPAIRIGGQTFVDSSRGVRSGNVLPIYANSYNLGDNSLPWSFVTANQLIVIDNAGLTRFVASGTINLYNTFGSSVFNVTNLGNLTTNGSVSTGIGFSASGVSGLTTNVSVPCGTLTFIGGILTSKGACP